MKKSTVLSTLANGGRIQNHTLINAQNIPVQGKGSQVTDSQIKAAIAAGATETIGYDRTRTYKY